MTIKFGTDGWRAMIAKDFTVENVAKVAYATAKWLNANTTNPRVVIGHDCRFAGELFVETVAKMLAYHNIKVLMAKGFVSTPMVSVGVVKLQANCGVVITASHNPPSDNGYKLKGSHGGPMLENDIKDVEKLIPEKLPFDCNKIDINHYIESKQIEIVNLEGIYIDHVKQSFNLENIENSKFKFAFDAMYGAGQNVFNHILTNTETLHCEHNPTFKGIAPEPLAKNLGEFSEFIKSKGNIDCGLAVDGDADRIALFDSKGNYIDSHHTILLLIHYLKKYRNLDGKVVTGFSSTVKVEKLCEHYNIPVQRVRIGFKDICKIMLEEKVLVGGEESGGISAITHIPERDGIWMGLTIWQAMVETGKSLTDLINEIYDITGAFAFKRSDLRIAPDLKEKIVKNCAENKYSEFGDYKVQRLETLDGYKYYFSENEWLMIRPSGTEPVLRTYAEAETAEKAADILKQGYDTIMK